MGQKRSARLLLCAMVLAAVFLTAGCREEKKESEPVIHPIDITITIDYPVSAEIEDVKAVPFTVEEKSTVLEAIQLYGTVNDMPVTIETTNGIVVGIHDLMNGDIFAQRTWQFKRNGELIRKPAGEVKLQDGDHLEWVYIK